MVKSMFFGARSIRISVLDFSFGCEYLGKLLRALDLRFLTAKIEMTTALPSHDCFED